MINARGTEKYELEIKKKREEKEEEERPEENGD